MNSIEPVETRKKTVRQRQATVDDDMPIREATRAEEKQRRPKEKNAQTDAVAQRHNLYTHDRRFPTAARVYYSDYQQKQEVMRAKTNTITTKLNDRQTVGAMLDVAEDRGWKSVKLRGTDDFKREAWVQAEARGIRTEGYKATNTDRQELERRVNAVAAKSGEAAPREPKPVKAARASDQAAAAAKEVPVAAQKPVHPVTEKDVWNVVEAQGKQARQQDQPVQKQTEKARASAAEAA
jgi:hypothetical protein